MSGFEFSIDEIAAPEPSDNEAKPARPPEKKVGLQEPRPQETSVSLQEVLAK